MNQKRQKKLRTVKNELQEFQWRWLLKQTGYTCVKCGKKGYLVRAHIRALGPGDNTLENIQPMHIECNQEMGRKTVDYRPDWLREKVEHYVQTWGKS